MSSKQRRRSTKTTLDVVGIQPTPPQIATRAVTSLPADSLEQSLMHSDHLRQHRFSGLRPGLSGTAPAATAGNTTHHPELVVLLRQDRKLGLQTANMMGHHMQLSAITLNHGTYAPSIKLVHSCHPLVEVTEKRIIINQINTSAHKAGQQLHPNTRKYSNVLTDPGKPPFPQKYYQLPAPYLR